MRKKILLGIDDDLIRELYSKHLSEAGFDVISSQSEKEILEIVQKKNLDLILLDIALEGVKGFEIMEKLRKMKEIPIFMFSVIERSGDRERALKLGAKDFIVSSLTTFNELVLKIKIFFGELKKYQFDVNIQSEDLKKWARDLGFPHPSFYCQKCSLPLQMLLIKEKEENLFKVVFICPNCQDIYFEK